MVHSVGVFPFALIKSVVKLTQSVGAPCGLRNFYEIISDGNVHTEAPRATPRLRVHQRDHICPTPMRFVITFVYSHVCMCLAQDYVSTIDLIGITLVYVSTSDLVRAKPHAHIQIFASLWKHSHIRMYALENHSYLCLCRSLRAYACVRACVPIPAIPTFCA